MTDDPPIPEDGSCAACGGERRSKGLKPIYRRHVRTDPFCSTECARRWHDVPLPAAQTPGRRAYVTTLPKSD